MAAVVGREAGYSKARLAGMRNLSEAQISARGAYRDTWEGDARRDVGNHSNRGLRARPSCL